MGIHIGSGAVRVRIVGVTANDMWGDGFYVGGATDVAFCSVVANHNRRQSMSIVEASCLFVPDSVFRDTGGTRPSAGIDMEPHQASQKVVNVRIENSKFINNAGGDIVIAGTRRRYDRRQSARTGISPSGHRPRKASTTSPSPSRSSRTSRTATREATCGSR